MAKITVHPRLIFLIQKPVKVLIYFIPRATVSVFVEIFGSVSPFNVSKIKFSEHGPKVNPVPMRLLSEADQVARMTPMRTNPFQKVNSTI
jgi:hypothetical protein